MHAPRRIVFDASAAKDERLDDLIMFLSCFDLVDAVIG
jgi:hypothetical protein